MNESISAKTKEQNLAFLFTAYLLTNNKSWRSLFGVLSLLGSVIFCSNTAAQIVPDNTLGMESSTVQPDNLNGQAIDLIEGGATRGTNLFHSFAEFNIAAEKGAYFANPEGINNILTRVTGSNASQILGTLGVLGNSNLFLLNPNGIFFGENARLNVNGSFFASTADSLLFDNGFEFSGSNPEAPPLLTVNIPVGLGFRDNPGEIVNRSYVKNSTDEFVGLEVAPGQNLTLVGGDIKFEAGEVRAKGGNIQLGGLSAAGTVDINDDGSLNFPEAVARADISLSNGADVDVRGTGGGSITINAGNLNLEAGEFGSSFIDAGITADSTSADAQAGNIIIDVAENLTLNDSRIINQVNSGGVGNSGNITISTGSLEATNGGRVAASTFGQGNAGNITLDVEGAVDISGGNIFSNVGSEAVGNIGKIFIEAKSVSLTDGAQLQAGIFSGGQGEAAGIISIKAEESISFAGTNSEGNVSGIFSDVESEAVGDGSDIELSANSVSLIDNAILNANNAGQGNAGDITITTGSVSLTNGAQLRNSTFGEGDAGSVGIQADGTVKLSGSNSSIFSNVERGGQGNGGEINIQAKSLSLSDGAQIQSGLRGSSEELPGGRGNGGKVNIDVRDTVTLMGVSESGLSSAIFTDVESGAIGNGGDINIKGRSLSLEDGAQINTTTFGQGDAGSISIDISENVLFANDSGALSQVGRTKGEQGEIIPGEGNAGNIEVTTANLSLTGGSQLTAGVFGNGDAGEVIINATESVLFQGTNESTGLSSGVFNNVAFGGEGNAGDIEITTDSLTLRDGGGISSITQGTGNAGKIDLVGRALSLKNGAQISTSTFGQGNAGQVTINASDTISVDGEDPSDDETVGGIFSTVGDGAIGNAGGVEITTGNLTLTNAGTINASTFGQGNAGQVTINASDTISIDGDDLEGFNSGAFSQVNSEAKGDAGGVAITTGNLSLTNGGTVSADTFGQGNAGSVEITATDTISIDGENSEGFVSEVSSAVALEEAEGNAGGVTIDTGSLSLTKGGRVIADTFGRGDAGTVNISATDKITIDGEDSEGFVSGVSSDVNSEAEGDAGGVTITTANLTLTNGGSVGASTFGQGNAGQVTINASNTISVDGEDPSDDETVGGIFSAVSDGATGNAGGVEITTGNLTLTNAGTISASTFGQGNAGQVTINASDTISIDGEDLEGSVSGVSSSVNEDAEGDAGGIIIETGSLSLTNGGTVSADTFGQGNAGSVEITASDTITIDGEDSEGFPSGATSLVNSEAEGDAGGITIDTGSLSLTNGGRVIADTFGQGNAGEVQITASNITIDGETLNGFPSETSSSVNQEAVGNAGGVTINTGSLSLTNGGRVIASTFGRGNAGDVTVNARESIAISGTTETESFRSGISADAFISSGDGGDVDVSTNRLTINDGGSIQAGNFDNVDSLDVFDPGTGQPGNINIEANSLSLNRGRIEATTQSEVGEAANINLTIAEDIFFKNNSSISARASGNANGGNVTINAEDGSIVAFPNQNNDIVANAQQGNGGNINITAQGIFGLEERRSDPPNQTNDIDASSEFGLQGDFSLNTPENEPSRGLVDLPENVVNPEDLISQNACKQRGTSKFSLTGRGGLPATPEQVHHSDEVEVGLVEPAMGTAAISKESPVFQGRTKIVPAKGWIRNERGEVFLVGYDPTVSNIAPQPENLDWCQPREDDEDDF